MNAHHAFVSLLWAVVLVGLTFLGLSFGHALKHHDLALWGHHPLFGSGMAALITALLGGFLTFGLSGRRH
ncbi:hypothetical protein ACS5PN_11770 [Roseateles sp. NT4]|uniref:hypothetical protein n=1 Tax=Roseateles sp. NT4 TaxID=3453715 RepID=UPI003EEF4E52